MGAEAHVASLVVHTYPEALARVARRVARVRGASVRARSGEGKLVVIVEGASQGDIADAVCRIQTLDGVLAATLVYHHAEPEETMNDEVEIEDHAP